MSGPTVSGQVVRGPGGVRADLRLVRERFSLEVELAVEPGERVVLVGPNGAGKSTTLRVLAGLERPTRAMITIGGQVVDDDRQHVPSHRRSIGVVFQDYLLFPHLSVLDNVAFGLTSRGLRTAEARQRAHGWLERVGLAELARARPREISGGQAQRVALARALAPEPALLLLDEPLAALDASTRMIVRAELRHQLAALDQAVIMVTHDPVDAAVLGERMLVLEHGQLVQQGTPAEIARRPRSDYVARLVGLNLVEGTATGTALRVDETTVHGANPCTGSACAAFRPVAVSLHLDRPTGSFRNVWSGVVVRVEPHGEAARVEVGDAVAGRPVMAEVTQVAVAELGLVPGRRVWAAVKATDVELYPT